MTESRSSVILDNGGDVRDVKTAQKYYEAARKAEEGGDRWSAIDSYEAAYAADPDSAEICFRLALNLDLVGEEDEALHLYEQIVHSPQPPLNALVNLAILYEDREQLAAAERCVRQVLATEPNHPRARLFIKDVLASKNMFIDEEQEADLEEQNELLDTPVTDFELSVKTRNGLRKMNIRTLGDLLRITDAELRSYKNLGEQGIEEVTAMLAQRGLKLGQAAEQAQSAAKKAVYDQLKTQTGQDDQMLNRTVNELNLSVRARKALTLLNIHTVGDLCTKTEAELMGVKNFGMTSLLEIKEQLAELGLSLRELSAEEASAAGLDAFSSDSLEETGAEMNGDEGNGAGL